MLPASGLSYEFNTTCLPFFQSIRKSRIKFQPNAHDNSPTLANGVYINGGDQQQSYILENVWELLFLLEV
jgi:hypothetical protein